MPVSLTDAAVLAVVAALVAVAIRSVLRSRGSCGSCPSSGSCAAAHGGAGWTDPTQARDLLREFATFYRQTLENSESRIPLARELEQTRRYLKFEYARFGEDRIVERESVEAGCADVPVPAFMVQPLVENAVRHAMRDEGPLHIDIHATREGGDVLVSVTDDGLGMDEATAERLLSRASAPDRDNPRGTGVALHNVAERVKRFYGIGSGVEIMSKPGEGTSVTVRLVGAASEGE